MRLIDADKLRYEIDKHYPFTKLPQAEHGIADRAKSELLLIIHEAPVVDAVEVVRCRDCKEFEKKRHPVFAGYCKEFDSYMADDDFCSCGERRK